MKQKTNRSNKRSSGSRENANINMRSVSNNLEVSRRSKGKNRYSYEEERRDSSRYYEDDYYQKDGKKMKKSSSPKSKEGDYGSVGVSDAEDVRTCSVKQSDICLRLYSLFYR